MSHPNPSGNGCSLEDCYTNLFALTDLCGIRWRKLTPEPDSLKIDPLDDPVLVAYSKCVRSDILSVWRRVPARNTDNNSHHHHHHHHPPPPPPQQDQLSFSKELWIFWYGDEPKGLADIISTGLAEIESGSWDKDKDKDSGLSYECRTLLFKALHNLIERCLLSKNFIRLGHWFVRPYDQYTTTERSAHLSFRFHFFLHGESQVCASIEVKQHPPVWRLTPQYLSLIQENQANFQVILAPYGLNGQLTGHSYRESDQSSRRLFEEWRQFYPVDTQEVKESDANNKLPNMVEVIVAGVRMKYPSCYVMICDNDDAPVRVQPLSVATGTSPRSQYNSSMMTPPASPCDPSLMSDVNVKLVPNTPVNGGLGDGGQYTTTGTANALSHHILERVSHHACVNSGMAKRANESNDEPAAGIWNFGEATNKMACNCVRHRKMKSGGQGKNISGKHAKSDKLDKLERQQSRHGRNVTPFHRRSLVTDDMLQFDMNIMINQPQTNPNFCGSGANNLPPGQSTPNDPNIDTPSSPPSPLDEPQPLVNSNMEPPMPTLSPHPPSKNNAEKEFSAKNPNVTDITNSVCVPNGEFFPKQEDQPLPGNKLEQSDNNYTCTQSEAKRESVNSWLQSQQKQVENHGLKRPPLLPTFEGDKGQEDLVTDSLYNFDPLNAWIELPVKKSRIDCSNSPSHFSDLTSPTHSDAPKAPTPPPPAPDPYEFSDEASFNPNPLKSRSRKSRDDIMPRQSPCGKSDDDSGRPGEMGPFGSPPTPSGSLMRVGDLVVQSTDLDHMFDSEDSSDGDDAGVSVHALINFDDDFMSELGTSKRLEEDMKHRACPGNIAPSELARMFPTPPSLETHKVQSPEVDMIHDTTQSITETICYRSEVSRFTPPEDMSRQDVFKPPKTAKFLSAPKYAPIELPSRQLSPVSTAPGYKPSWQYPMSVLPMEKQQPVISSYINIPSIENVSSCMSRNIPSPATFTNINSNQQRTPMSYELQSPASNASSYLNKTLNSVDNQGTNHQIPEVNSLLVNVILSDSLLNLYKDHNFDSCNICVCNFDIKGADVGPYLPDIGNSESSFKCICGFSAVVNRKYGYHSGLFYEDEVDITGIRDNRFDKRKHSLLGIDWDNGLTMSDKEEDDIPHEIIRLLIDQFTVPFLTNVSEQRLAKLNMMAATSLVSTTWDALQLQDGNDISYNALEQGIQSMENTSPTKLDDPSMRTSCLHKWPFLRGASRIPVSSQDVVNLHKSLQPILQDAIQNKRVTRMWEHSYKLQGPLSWKDFHQLAGRGSDENCEPQPIPFFLVSNDGDWLSVSPYSVRFWDKQFVEPFAKSRDIAYVVVAPENDFILSNVRDFFKELSTVYKLCRLGKHCPIAKIRDGIMRVGKTRAQKLSDESVLDDEWFKNIGDSQVAEKLRLYARVCRYILGPYLNQQKLDSALFEAPEAPKPQFKTPEPTSTHPPTPENPSSNNTEEKDSTPSESTNQEKAENHDIDSDDTNIPAIVVYMIDPFTYDNDWDELNRLSMIGLLRCYREMVKILPEHLKNNISLQIIPLKTILGHKENSGQFQSLKSIAFSIFTTCRWNLSHTIMGRSLTGFGPAAAAEVIVKRKEVDKGGSQRLYAPPFILAPLKDKQAQLAESCGGKTENGNVLFCGYCLSEDQRWLLSVVTDERGELMETCVVNIEIPNRNRRKKASARKIGLRKLWDFLVGVVSMSNMAARLVIGRFGRIGHGELKGWSGLLSKKNLAAVSHKLKDMCGQCEVLNNGAVPSILSACLVSLEPHSSFQIMADALKAEEKMSSNCPLQTPRDASATHILVFPISATAQANSMPLQPEGQIDFNNTQLDFNDDIGLFGGIKDEDLGNMDQGMEMFADVFSGFDQMDYPVGSGNSPPGSPSGEGHGRQNSRSNGPSTGSCSTNQSDPQEEVNLLQQPLAMGYYVSTARPGPMPKWFWSGSPENAHVCPNTFKAALHVHCSSSHDEFYNHSHASRNTHPLDSHLTCDVLRFVLENYNALSWLTYDPGKNDRRSCLPVHLDMLMQMYHAVSAFI
ncbi:mediator of RNA polymerase II transcription subunit 13 isoform X3 [Patella vulgata]|uniref:mediator of RNA polymerase II transcription subunit 13 isoform X3 n=1 Tax=Patella vulgata TaxID=6465 RepID=UPI00218086F8|nr:mediator of RNA polymerase II transcription subunit 13 isoform X3 [Patella vulgata]